ncbi:MAG: PAS domain S-box protein [Magnetococcales bacterium]|nr:PAS domain S-box protein [Magnetococcales bacterium]
MSQKSILNDKFIELRQLAEKIVLASPSGDMGIRSTQKIDSLLHELQVHQIELEIQNEELRKSELELAKARDDYSVLYDYAPVGYITLSPLGIIRGANLTASNMLGKDRAELVGDKVAHHIHHDDRDLIYIHCNAVLASDTMKRCEVRFSGEGGDYFFSRLESIALRDNENRSLQILTTISNIDQLVQSENSLIESEERFRVLSESATDGIISIDYNGIITYWNKMAERIFKFSSVEALGKPISIIIPARYKNKHLLAIKRANETGKMNHKLGEVLLFVGKCKDGCEVPLEITLASWSVGGEITFTSFIRDVSERRRIEKRLRQSQKLEAVGTLSGGVAHDFNNILGIIAGNAELLSMKESYVNEEIKSILKASQRGADLVRQLLTIGRRSQTSNELFDPKPIVNEVLRLMRSTLPSTIEFKTSIDVQGHKVLMSSSHLYQVLVNICTNAGQAMGEDGGEFEFIMKPVEILADSASTLSVAPGNFLQIMVRDTGPGISPKIQERMFEPFYTTKEQGKGTGLGLAVAHSIIEECGGAIEVDSQVGKGAEFKVFFPSIKDDKKPQNVADEIASIQKGNGRVLFVDDEPSLVDVAVKMLKALGYEPVGFSDSKKALDYFLKEADSYVAVVTDQVMPGMTGNIMARKILDVRPDIPIFLCTGFSEKISDKSAAEFGFQSVFMKPVSLSELSQALKKSISQVKSVKQKS